MEMMFGLFAVCGVGIVAMTADSMWRAWLIAKSLQVAVKELKGAQDDSPSPAELNTMDCQGGQ